ncbi:MAG: Ig-like domain-containing protein [Gemmatimonadales bacterium]
MQVGPDTGTVLVTGTRQLTATPRDASGNAIAGKTVTFVSRNLAVASVTASGLVTGEAIGTAVIEATADGVTGSATLTVGPAWSPGVVTQRSGRIELPPGAAIPVDAIRLSTSLGPVAVTPTGQFSTPAFGTGPQLLVATAPDGRPLLLGWLTGTTVTLNARSTAEAMAYFDLGGAFLPAAARDFLREQVAGRSEVAALEAAVATALGAPAATVSVDVPAVLAARHTLRTQLAGSALLPARVAATAGRKPVISIDPLGARSGVVPHEVDLNILQVTNQYRRRAVGLIDAVSYDDADGNPHAAPSGGQTTELEIPPTVGLTSFGGLLADVVLGNLAWAEVESDAVPLPIAPADATATRYRLRVLGLGALSLAELNALPPAVKARLGRVVATSAVADVLVPVFLNVILDGDVAGDRIEAALKQPGAANYLNDCVGFLVGSLPEFADLMYQGRVKEGADLLWTTVLSSDSFQQLIFDLTSAVAGAILQDAARGEALRAISQYGKAFLGFISKVDLVMTASDVSLQLWQAYNSRAVETWELTVRPSKVKLNPGTNRISTADIRLLKAVVLGLEGVAEGAALSYEWSATGAAGVLVDAQHRGTHFESSSDAVTYEPSGSLGSDVVTVTVRREEAGVGTVVVGTAKATVEVGPVTVTLTPDRPELAHREPVTFTASVPSELAEGAVLSYRWNTPGALGAFDRGLHSIQGAANRVTYTAGRSLIGEEEVTVEVFATRGEEVTSLGTDQAIVTVTRAPFTIEPGAPRVAPDAVLELVARPFGDRPDHPRYRWDFGDGTAPVVVVGDSVVSHVYHVGGDYHVSVDLEDADLDKRAATAGAAVTVGTVTLEPAATTAGIGEQVAWVAMPHGQAPPGATFIWDFGDDTGFEGDSVAAHAYGALGTYQVSVEMHHPDDGRLLGRARGTVSVENLSTTWRLNQFTGTAPAWTPTAVATKGDFESFSGFFERVRQQPTAALITYRPADPVTGLPASASIALVPPPGGVSRTSVGLGINRTSAPCEEADFVTWTGDIGSGTLDGGSTFDCVNGVPARVAVTRSTLQATKAGLFLQGTITVRYRDIKKTSVVVGGKPATQLDVLETREVTYQFTAVRGN